MRGVHNQVFLALFYRLVLTQPIQSNDTISSTLRPPSNEEHMVVVGKNLIEIPFGSSTTKTLNLAYNHISTLPEQVFSNKSYTSLTVIQLYQNKLNLIHVRAFRGLKQLTSLNLADNNISVVDPYTCKANPKLEKLDLSGNKIILSRLQVFLVSASLETLILSQNRIEQVYELNFVGLPNLKTLMLNDNALCSISANSFRPLNKLNYLSVANTGVYRLSESMFGSNLPRIVDLEDTPLANIFISPLTKISNTAVRQLLSFEESVHITYDGTSLKS